MRAWCVVATLLLATSAQASQMTIHFTDDVGPSPGGGENCLGQRGWLLSDAAPPAAGKAYMSMTSPGLGCATTFTFTAVESFITEGPFVVAVQYDCDTPTVVGSSPATSGTRFTLTHNGAEVGMVTNGVFAPCTGPINDGASLGSSGRLVEAGDELRLQILWWGADVVAQAPSLHVVTGPARPSTITFDYSTPAIEGPETAILHEDLAAPAVVHAFANATSDTYILNFTTELANATANFAWNATAGRVNATLMDANGTVLYNGTLQSNGSIAHVITNAVAGEWNLTLAYDRFAGDFSFDLASNATAGDSEDAVDHRGNHTESLDHTPGADSPLPVILPLLGKAAAIVVRRRH